MTGNREHRDTPGRIRGHADGSFYNRLAKVLGEYMREVMVELAGRGLIRTDEEGHPLVRVIEASAVYGTAQVEVEADMRPMGLASNTPLRATWIPGEGRIHWRMHSAPVCETPCEWSPEDAASRLTPEKLRDAHERFLGHEPPGRGR